MAIRVTRTGVVLAVGILIGAVILFGLLQIVRDRGEQARREEAIAIAEENLKTESEQGIAIEVKDEPSTEGAATESSPASGAEAVATNELPQTGPEVGALVVVGFVTFALISYWRSRKLVYEQL